MKIFDLPNSRPEWVENPKAHRAEISDSAHAFIWDLFKMEAPIRKAVFWHDLAALVNYRALLLDFSETDGQDSDTANKILILELLIKSVAWHLNEYAYLLDSRELTDFYLERGADIDFIDIKTWPTKAQAPQNTTNQKGRYLPGFKDNEAKAIYKRLTDSRLIDSSEDLFIWYFGEPKHRANQEPPADKIKWLPETGNSYVFFCMEIKKKMCGESGNIKWQLFDQAIEHKPLKSYTHTAKEINEGSYPALAGVIEKCLNE